MKQIVSVVLAVELRSRDTDMSPMEIWNSLK